MGFMCTMGRVGRHVTSTTAGIGLVAINEYHYRINELVGASW